MSTKKGQGKITKKDVITKEREDQWRIDPCRGIPTYSAEKDPHCPNGQIRKFNEEKKLKSQILAQREKATASFIKTTLDHSLEDLTDMKYKSANELKSKVKSRDSYAEIEILQKIVVRENLLAELQKLLKSQNDVSVCLNEVVELIKALRFQTLDIIEDINAWQQTQPKVRAFEYKGSNYLVKIKCDLDFLDLYEEIVEKFCFEFNSNPLAYRGGGNVITGYSADPRKKAYSQGLLQSYYSKADDAQLHGLDVTRLHNAEKVIQSEFQRIGREKSRGHELVQQQSQHSHQSDVLDRDIFTALSKSTNNLHLESAHNTAHNAHTAHSADATDAFEVGNAAGASGKKGKKNRKASKSAALNPKKAKLERISLLQEEASELKAMIVNVDEKVQFLTDHHHDLLNQRAALDSRLKEAKALGREVAATHIAAEISVNTAVVLDNSTKVKDLQRESYFINLERKRKLGTAQKLREEMEKDKERAALQKKIGSLIKKEGLLAALASFHTKETKMTATEIALIGDKALDKSADRGDKMTRPKSAGMKSSSPPKSAGKSKRVSSGSDTGKDKESMTNNANSGMQGMNNSASAPALGTAHLPPLHATAPHSSNNNGQPNNYSSSGGYVENSQHNGYRSHNYDASDSNNYHGGNFGGTIYENEELGGEEWEHGGDERSDEEEEEGSEGEEEEDGEEGSGDKAEEGGGGQYQQYAGEGGDSSDAHETNNQPAYQDQTGQYTEYAENQYNQQQYTEDPYNQQQYSEDTYNQQQYNQQYVQYAGQDLHSTHIDHKFDQHAATTYDQGGEAKHDLYQYSHADTYASHTDGDTLHGEHLLDAHSHASTHMAAGDDDDLSMQISPVRHHHNSGVNSTGNSHNSHGFLSPSEGSHGSKESPLGYSLNSLGDVSDVHPHEMRDDQHRHQFEHNDGMSGHEHGDDGVPSEHMYISDDEEHHSESEHLPRHRKQGGTIGSHSQASSQVPAAGQSQGFQGGQQGGGVSVLDMSDLSLSPMSLSMHSPALNDPRSNQADDYTNRQLFGDSVSLDGAAEGDYPAGGAYGLVKKLKLSPRPA